MKGKNIFIVILLCGLCAFAGAYVGINYFSDDKNVEDKDDDTENNKTEETPKKEDKKDKEVKETKEDKTSFDKEQVLSTMAGDWGRCEDANTCYGIYITKDKGTYKYLSYIMWSESGVLSPIKTITKVDDYVYKLNIHVDFYEDAMITISEHDIDTTIDISNASKGFLVVDGDEYKKVVGDSDTFYRNYFK